MDVEIFESAKKNTCGGASFHSYTVYSSSVHSRLEFSGCSATRFDHSRCQWSLYRVHSSSVTADGLSQDRPETLTKAFVKYVINHGVYNSIHKIQHKYSKAAIISL